MKRLIYLTGRVIITGLEMYALAECVWYVVTDGGHLYELVLEQFGKLRTRLHYRLQVMDTLRMIRELPEQS